jgi:hypothetical protein
MLLPVNRSVNRTDSLCCRQEGVRDNHVPETQSDQRSLFEGGAGEPIALPNEVLWHPAARSHFVQKAIGNDPAAKRTADRQAICMSDLVAAYLQHQEQHAKRSTLTSVAGIEQVCSRTSCRGADKH